MMKLISLLYDKTYLVVLLCLLFVSRQIPMELVHAAQGGEVDINLEDRRNEEYVRSKPKLKAFSGEGRKLGK